MDEVRIERTGNIFSFAATEYKAVFPDGTETSIWSPPWHEWDDEEEDRRSLEYAQKLWKEKQECQEKGK